MFEDQSIWCGSLASYDAVVKAASSDETVAFDVPSLVSKAGTTSVVSISGPLVNGDAGFMAIFGVTGYNDIRSAIVEAMADKETTSVVLDFDTPGGQVAGVDDLAQFIKQAGQIKPIVSYSGGQMASAGYWLGSGAENVVVSETSDIGSIGVLAVHREYSEQLKQDGVKAEVIRAGKYKAITNSIEPLSQAGRDVLTASVNETYDTFWGRVADNRGLSAEMRETAAEGRVFSGKKAVAAGLADDVGTFEDALALASAMAEQRKGKKPAAKAGAQVVGKVATSTIQSHNPHQERTNMTQRAQLPTDATDVQAFVSSGLEAAIVAKAAAVAELDEFKANFDAKLAEAKAAFDADVAKLQADAQAAQEKADQAVKVADQLKAIVVASADHMAVALNEPKLADVSITEIVETHATLETKFKAKFKSGGVVATAPAKEGAKPALVDPMFAMMAKSIPNR